MPRASLCRAGDPCPAGHPFNPLQHLRLAVALLFAAPAAIAGYALVHGIATQAVPSEVWRQVFSIVGGSFVGLSAVMRLAADISPPSR